MVRVIAFSGPVASGKSTILESIYKILSVSHSVHIIREYIDALSDANDKLTAYLNNQLSAYAFQNYILDYFDASSKLDNEYDYVLVERCPMEGLKFFARLDVKNKRMTEDEYQKLIDRASLMSFYPNPDNCKNILKIDTDDMLPDGITGLVYDFINDVDIIQLIAKPMTIKQRIIQRGRIAEINAYDDKYLNYMCGMYYK